MFSCFFFVCSDFVLELRPAHQDVEAAFSEVQRLLTPEALTTLRQYLTKATLAPFDISEKMQEVCSCFYFSFYIFFSFFSVFYLFFYYYYYYFFFSFFIYFFLCTKRCYVFFFYICSCQGCNHTNKDFFLLNYLS